MKVYVYEFHLWTELRTPVCILSTSFISVSIFSVWCYSSVLYLNGTHFNVLSNPLQVVSYCSAPNRGSFSHTLGLILTSSALILLLMHSNENREGTEYCTFIWIHCKVIREKGKLFLSKQDNEPLKCLTGCKVGHSHLEVEAVGWPPMICQELYIV